MSKEIAVVDAPKEKVSQTGQLREELMATLYRCPELMAKAAEYHYGSKTSKYKNPTTISFLKGEVDYKLEVDSALVEDQEGNYETIEIHAVGPESNEIFKIESGINGEHFSYQNVAENSAIFIDNEEAITVFQGLIRDLRVNAVEISFINKNSPA